VTWGAYDGLRAMALGEAPRVGEKVHVAGLTVSTVDTWDLGWETAVIDAAGTHAVERYATEAEALAGHARWVAAAPTLTEVVRIGTGDGAVDDVVVTLTPRAP
jgi:hypothetical protein